MTPNPPVTTAFSELTPNYLSCPESVSHMQLVQSAMESLASACVRHFQDKTGAGALSQEQLLQVQSHLAQLQAQVQAHVQTHVHQLEQDELVLQYQQETASTSAAAASFQDNQQQSLLLTPPLSLSDNDLLFGPSGIASLSPALHAPVHNIHPALASVFHRPPQQQQQLLQPQHHLAPSPVLQSAVQNIDQVDPDNLSLNFYPFEVQENSFLNTDPSQSHFSQRPQIPTPTYLNDSDHSILQAAVLLASQTQQAPPPWISPDLAATQLALAQYYALDKRNPPTHNAASNQGAADLPIAADSSDVDDIASETFGAPVMRQSYTNGQKLQIIEDAELLGVREAIRLSGLDLHASMVYRWMNTKKKLSQHRSTARKTGSGRKPALSLEYEQAIVGWIQEQRNHRLNVSFSVVRKFAKSLMPPGSDMKLSSGWFMGFCRRNNIGQLCESSL
ncbi:hypothetical protein BASA62_008174 [Batrachochytrium salamandrivorans]|nr:hypothetical protein BASA62_008174 [Batrachochytrium salamandrivorans]